jgi:hypothetical protein
MDVRSALKSQYHAALKTLHEVIQKCPDGMWNDPADPSAPFWRVVYHTLFYAHFYLQQTHSCLSRGSVPDLDISFFAPRCEHPAVVAQNCCLDMVPLVVQR